MKIELQRSSHKSSEGAMLAVIKYEAESLSVKINNQEKKENSLTMIIYWVIQSIHSLQRFVLPASSMILSRYLAIGKCIDISSVAFCQGHLCLISVSKPSWNFRTTYTILIPALVSMMINHMNTQASGHWHDFPHIVIKYSFITNTNADKIK